VIYVHADFSVAVSFNFAPLGRDEAYKVYPPKFLIFALKGANISG
jgi:hypothetical protein